ncbi:MAG: lipoyl synthase [Planctomycetes bacterium]|nr:lipoyl synthase [Planctomycetota bacterium]
MRAGGPPISTTKIRITSRNRKVLGTVIRSPESGTGRDPTLRNDLECKSRTIIPPLPEVLSGQTLETSRHPIRAQNEPTGRWQELAKALENPPGRPGRGPRRSPSLLLRLSTSWNYCPKAKRCGATSTYYSVTCNLRCRRFVLPCPHRGLALQQSCPRPRFQTRHRDPPGQVNRSTAIDTPSRKPGWLKIRPPAGAAYQRIKSLRQGLTLATVCEEARCPNQAECWGGGTATFMILGDTCTRGCRFCNVKTGNPKGGLDADEPAKLAEAVLAMDLEYVVLTMVDRDDLEDGGAAHARLCIEALKAARPTIRVEMLAGDFRGRVADIEAVTRSGCEVFAHNIETVRRLTPQVRDRKCGYDQTLEVLRVAKAAKPAVVTKSSIMLGLGERDEEVETTLRDLRGVGVEIVTLGQYLRPAEKFLPVVDYVHPDAFAAWQQRAEAMGFAFCASGPLVRSSYRAGELFLTRYLDQRAAAAANAEPGPA